MFGKQNATKLEKWSHNITFRTLRIIARTRTSPTICKVAEFYKSENVQSRILLSFAK
jgi:hypothetical protein